MDRKEIVKAIGEHFGVKPKYLGAPNFNYQIETEHETFIVDREGQITTSEGRNVEFEALLNGMIEEEVATPEAEESKGLSIAVTMNGHTGISLTNLVNMINSKQSLIKKALEIEEDIVSDKLVTTLNEAKVGTIEEFQKAICDTKCSCVDFNFDYNEITFKFFRERDSPEKIKAYTQLVELLSEKAQKLKNASAKEKATDNEKFTFRVWLNRLGMIGDEYKETRKLLLQNLTGNSAFRYGKPEKETNIWE
ncbi:hypothetical protein CD30_13050 [Ureibacillus massiliensis 4400831 = CIP 108448 = CCUG 49529]|uniref:Virulence-related protein n=1 Tax=Ureibacillus massiliensis 4400831 = CIP 108448 = CCUG 49529 TaxID=1211035 RepID=A0A0A3J4T0_9BACL|nr:hypothetical protein [Ureibacillus massiliensis]KGR90173.1 hypothetical protein CD30_13050 [Ureibacillus massiliensis 4400831 = CIP 108448 = CCUG 49529]